MRSASRNIYATTQPFQPSPASNALKVCDARSQKHWPLYRRWVARPGPCRNCWRGTRRAENRMCMLSCLTLRCVLSAWCSSTVKRLSLKKKRKLTSIFFEANHLYLSSYLDTSAPLPSPNLFYQPSNFHPVELTNDNMLALALPTKWHLDWKSLAELAFTLLSTT